MQIFIKYDKIELDGRVKDGSTKKRDNKGMDWRRYYNKEEHNLKIKRYREKKRRLGYIKNA